MLGSLSSSTTLLSSLLSNARLRTSIFCLAVSCQIKKKRSTISCCLASVCCICKQRATMRRCTESRCARLEEWNGWRSGSPNSWHDNTVVRGQLGTAASVINSMLQIIAGFTPSRIVIPSREEMLLATERWQPDLHRVITRLLPVVDNFANPAWLVAKSLCARTCAHVCGCVPR